MSDGTVLKAEKDFTKDVDKLLPEARELASVRLFNLLNTESKLTLLFRQMYKLL